MYLLLTQVGSICTFGVRSNRREILPGWLTVAWASPNFVLPKFIFSNTNSSLLSCLGVGYLIGIHIYIYILIYLYIYIYNSQSLVRPTTKMNAVLSWSMDEVIMS